MKPASKKENEIVIVNVYNNNYYSCNNDSEHLIVLMDYLKDNIKVPFGDCS